MRVCAIASIPAVTLTAACGGSRGDDASLRRARTDAALSPPRPATARMRQTERIARSHVGALTSGEPITNRDWRLISSGPARKLPHYRSSTVRLRSSGAPLRGKFWLAPGLSPREPVCEFFQLDRSMGAGYSCFALGTIQDGRAMEVYNRKGWTDVTGIAPSDAHAVVVSRTRARVSVRTRDEAYAVGVPFYPTDVTLIRRDHNIHIRLHGP